MVVKLRSALVKSLWRVRTPHLLQQERKQKTSGILGREKSGKRFRSCGDEAKGNLKKERITKDVRYQE